MSNMSDLSALPRITPATAAKWEDVALSLARVERQLGELADHLAHQQTSLARTRTQLITILWPKATHTEKETSL